MQPGIEDVVDRFRVVPERVPLLVAGRFGTPLCGGRSAREFGLAVNARAELPDALSLAPGTLPAAEAAAAVGDGLWIADL